MRQFIAAIACSLLLVPAHATDDDRYSYSPPRFQNYQTPYKPPSNYSPTQFLDRQINNQNAALQHRFGARAEFKPTAFTLASVNTPAWAPPRFEFSPPNFKPLATFKADLPKPALSKPEPKGFLGSIGAGVKGVFNALAAAVQKVGQAIGKMFTIDKAKITYEAQRDRLLKDNPSLRQFSKGVFQVSPGQQFQHAGLTWEPNSTFKMNDDGRGLHLDLGVTLSPDLGGIRRADGQPLPVIMTLDDNRLTPVGIDFSRVEPKTPFNYTHPVAISGLGTVPAGATMTFEGLKPGAPNTPPLVSLSFQNARIDNPGKALEGIANPRNEKITLTQMEVRLQGKLNEINSLRVNRGDEKLFVSQYGETFSVSQLEKKTAQAAVLSTDLAQQSRKLTADVNSSVIHSNKLTQDLHNHTGTPTTLDFQTKTPVAEQSALSKAIEQKTHEMTAHMAIGDYSQVANAISQVEAAQAAIQGDIKNQQFQIDSFQKYKRSLKGLEQAYGQMLTNKADTRSIETAVVTAEQIQDAAPYFQQEKNAVRIKTMDALNALDAMESAGIITTAENALKSTEFIVFARQLLAAKPDVAGNRIIATAAAIEESYQSTSRDFDDEIFKHLYNMADRYPRTMQTVGQGVLAVAGGAAIVGLIYSAINAPATTVVALEAGIVSQKTFEAMGVSPEAAAACAAIVTSPVVVVAPSMRALKATDEIIINGTKGSVSSFADGINRRISNAWRRFGNFLSDESITMRRQDGMAFLGFLQRGSIVKSGSFPGSGIKIRSGLSPNDYVISVSGKNLPGYLAGKGARLGRPGQAVWVAPMDDALTWNFRSDAVTQTGHAPSVLKSYLKGEDLFGIAIPVKRLSLRQSVASDANDYRHWRFGGFTGVEHNGSWTTNTTKEFVFDGGIPVPKGSILFKLNPDGSWSEVRRF